MKKLFIFLMLLFSHPCFAYTLPYEHKGLTIVSVEKRDKTIIKGHYDMFLIHKKFIVSGQIENNKFFMDDAVVNDKHITIKDHLMIKNKLEHAINKMLRN